MICKEFFNFSLYHAIFKVIQKYEFNLKINLFKGPFAKFPKGFFRGFFSLITI